MIAQHKHIIYYLILDETQYLYQNCENFLSTMKKTVKTNFRCLCFAGYGVDQPGTKISTPIQFKDCKSVEFLRLLDDEFKELMMNYNEKSNQGSRVHISQQIAEFLKILLYY